MVGRGGTLFPSGGDTTVNHQYILSSKTSDQKRGELTNVDKSGGAGVGHKQDVYFWFRIYLYTIQSGRPWGEGVPSKWIKWGGSKRSVFGGTSLMNDP